MSKKFSLQEALFEYGDFWSSKEGISLAQQREQEMLRANEQLNDELQRQFSDWNLDQRTDHGDTLFILQKSAKYPNDHKLFLNKEMTWEMHVSMYQMANGNITVESWVYLFDGPASLNKKIHDERLKELSFKLPWREEYVNKLFAILKQGYERARQTALSQGNIANESFNMVGDHEQSQSLGPNFTKLQMWGNGQSNLYHSPGSIQQRLFNPNSDPENLEDEDFPYMREGVHAVSGPVNTEDTWGKDVIHSEEEYELMPEALASTESTNPNIQRAIENIGDVLTGDPSWSKLRVNSYKDAPETTISSIAVLHDVKVYLTVVLSDSPVEGMRAEFYVADGGMRKTSIQTLTGETAFDHDAINHAITTATQQTIGKLYKNESVDNEDQEMLLDEEDHARISTQGEMIEHSAALFHDAMTEFGFELMHEPGPGLQHKNLELYLAFRSTQNPNQGIVSMLQYQPDGSLRLGIAMNSKNKTTIDFRNGKIDEGDLGQIKSAVNTLFQREQESNVNEGYEESSAERHEAQQVVLRNGLDAVEQSLHAMFEQELVEGEAWTLNARSKEENPYLLNLTFEHQAEPFVKVWFHCSFNQKPVYLKISAVAYKSAKVQKSMDLKIKPSGENEFALSGEQMQGIASRVNSLIGALQES